MIDVRLKRIDIDTLEFTDINNNAAPFPELRTAQFQKHNSRFIIVGLADVTETMNAVNKGIHYNMVHGTGTVQASDDTPSFKVEFDFKCGLIECKVYGDDAEFVIALDVKGNETIRVCNIEEDPAMKAFLAGVVKRAIRKYKEEKKKTE